MLFMGIDAGTQGVRAVIVDEKGNLRAGHRAALQRLNISSEENRYEQSPLDWENALRSATLECVAQLRRDGSSPEDIAALSIDGTSGTILPLDHDFRPLTDALMYNDPRAKAEAQTVHEAMGAHERKLGLRFGASFSLPRILWIKNHQPDIYERTRIFAHQADYVCGLLCGEYEISDYSNALKTGYDLIGETWPDEIQSVLQIDVSKLPEIVRPGKPIARITQAAAAKFGLSEKTMVTGGSTDGYASALAAGAVKAGAWASIIGTTFVLKGITDRLIIDPTGSAYSHRLPSGEWLLGGASNLGGRCLNACAEGRGFAELDKASEALIPTGARCYPLTGKGERFPFVSDQAEAFYLGDILNGKLYPALMEGVGFAERYALSRMAKIGCPVGDVICAAGGASKSDLWLRIRASILKKTLVVPAFVDASMGSALLAAGEAFGSLADAAEGMIHYEKTVLPDPALTARYDDLYGRFEQDIRRIYAL